MVFDMERGSYTALSDRAGQAHGSVSHAAEGVMTSIAGILSSKSSALQGARRSRAASSRHGPA